MTTRSSDAKEKMTSKHYLAVQVKLLLLTAKNIIFEEKLKNLVSAGEKKKPFSSVNDDSKTLCKSYSGGGPILLTAVVVNNFMTIFT